MERRKNVRNEMVKEKRDEGEMEVEWEGREVSKEGGWGWRKGQGEARKGARGAMEAW